MLYLWMLLGSTIMVQGQKALPAAEWGSSLRALVESERAFARAAAVLGTRDSFLAFLAEDAVLFRPGPVPGRKWLQEHPPTAGLLSWRPVFADLSAAGDLGYTTGPYEFRKQPQIVVVPSSYGNYFTIWQKQPDSSWKVLLDFGIANPAPANYAADYIPDRAKEAVLFGVRDSGDVQRDLIMEDDKLGATVSSSGIDSLLAATDGSARFLHAGMAPAVGASEIRSLLAAERGKRSWVPMKSGASQSGDLGYTYGSYSIGNGNATPKQGYYVRIWKRQPSGAWKVSLEVVNY